jgi:trk system potassium uptake protein
MRAVVVGCGRVGARLVVELASRDVEVVAIDTDPAATAALSPAVEVVVGSPLDHDVLARSGILRADGVALVTGDDAVNTVLAIHARRTFRVPIVVARLQDPRRAALGQRLGVRTLSPVIWGVQRFADLLRPGPVHTDVRLGTGQVEVAEVRVPPLLDGRPAGELELPGETHVVALTRHGRTTLATSATHLESGDLVHVAIAETAKGRLEGLLGVEGR